MIKMTEKILISRHQGAIDWIKKHYSQFEDLKCIIHATPEDIKDNIIIGTLPINLAVLSKEYWHLSMDIPVEMRGKELTIEDMENFNCKIVQYDINIHCNCGKYGESEAGYCYVCNKCGKPTRFF